MAILKKAQSVFAEVIRRCDMLSSVLIFVMMVLVTLDVLGRYLFANPVPGTLEISQMLMVVIVFFAYAYTEASDKNIKAELVDKYVSVRKKYLLQAFAAFIGLGIFSIICWQGSQQAWLSMSIGERTIGEVRIVLWPSKVILVIGSFFLVVQNAINMVSKLKKGFQKN